MRLFTATLSLVIAVILLGCGLSIGGHKDMENDDKSPTVVSTLPSPGTTSEIDDESLSVVSAIPQPSINPKTDNIAQAVVSNTLTGVAPISYLGPTSLEERVLKSPVIARVQLESATSTAEYGTTHLGMKHIAVIEFSFSVLEYLKGNGANDIVAVWAAAPFFDTRQEAQAALPAISAARNSQWDEHEAIVFLQQDSGGFLASTQQADRYYLAWGGSWSIPDDGYSIASVHDKLWLPAEEAVGEPSQPAGDQQRFLTDTPPATGTAPTITLGEIKTGIAAVAAKLDAGDGSEEYTECVSRTYWYDGINQYQISTGGEGFFYRTPDQKLGSGLAASTVVYETIAYGGLQNERAEVWLDGGDASLFSVEFSAGVPYDFSGDGTIDSTQYIQRVESARPLPAGVYRTHYNNRDAVFVPCEGYTTRHEWTVTVTAPEGVLHEAFFDPVTDGSAVAADSTVGVLEPASFIDSGATTTIERIEWEAGTAKMKITPHTALAGRVVDFIELDGTVSLSLVVDDSTVDAANNTLSWPVSSQPWDDGDKLMVRMR